MEWRSEKRRSVPRDRETSVIDPSCENGGTLRAPLGFSLELSLRSLHTGAVMRAGLHDFDYRIKFKRSHLTPRKRSRSQDSMPIAGALFSSSC